MNSSEIEELFAQTLFADYESEEGWAAVHALRRDGSRETFEHAAAWCQSDDPLKRARAADILCQLGCAANPNAPAERPERVFRDESYLLVTRMLENEQDLNVLDSAISALGHLGDAKAVPLILRYRDDPDKSVRFAVAFALGSFPNDEQSVVALLKLTADPDAGVRDWAAFGLGVLGDADSPEIREALLRCLNDADEDVREEAAVGLGKRQDRRLIPKLRTMLDEPGLKIRVAEAAAALLELDPDPEEWDAADYKAALRRKFHLED